MHERNSIFHISCENKSAPRRNRKHIFRFWNDICRNFRIIDIELKGLYSRVKNIGYKLVIDEDAKKFVATKGYDVQFGARPLKRAIQNNLEDGISELILGSEMAAGDTIKVSYDKEKDLIVMTVEK